MIASRSRAKAQRSGHICQIEQGCVAASLVLFGQISGLRGLLAAQKPSRLFSVDGLLRDRAGLPAAELSVTWFFMLGLW